MCKENLIHFCDTLPLKMIKYTYVYNRTANGHPTQVSQFCLQKDMRQLVMHVQSCCWLLFKFIDMLKNGRNF
jgi:hypothetical protein